ncbi:hypothetical protein DWUX_2302 [Desulfovibrio diazotrophicus]|nr:hypothetical protein DWUX_2302 [Desulfovibrio diazotrophicus]
MRRPFGRQPGCIRFPTTARVLVPHGRACKARIGTAVSACAASRKGATWRMAPSLAVPCRSEKARRGLGGVGAVRHAKAASPRRKRRTGKESLRRGRPSP